MIFFFNYWKKFHAKLKKKLRIMFLMKKRETGEEN